jgi:hypothetical protein
MSPTKLGCPHCGAVLKSSKTLRAGKQITCVKCQERFAYSPEMEVHSTGNSHAGTFHMLAESQPGTGRSPVAGMNLTATVASPPKETPDSQTESAEPPPLVVAPPRQRSLGGFVFALVVLLLFVGGGTALAIFFLSRDAEPAGALEPVASKPKKKELPQAKLLPKQKKQDPEPDPDSLKTVSKAEQKQIDEAIEKGVRFLLAEIKPWGNWDTEDGENAAGYAALPALALLESKVPPSDAVVQKAADFVRKRGPDLIETYDIGLAVVFLDRLGDKRDRNLIRSLAYRLVAGQSSDGGWGYKCPVLTATEEREVEEFLKNHRPRLDLFDLIESDLRGPELKRKERIKKGKSNDPVVKNPLSDKVANLPIVKFQQGKAMEFLGRDDNSNTLFGLLGLWAGRRHSVEAELALEFVARRFRETQRGDGGWGYVLKSPTKNTMTCAGLLGLAMGHGAAAEMVADAVSQGHIPKAAKNDPYIQDALASLGKYIDGDPERKGLESRIDFYYLWTLERVGMLYRQKSIGKRDWYRWGVKFVLEHQKPAGQWQEHYSAPVDTSFALLFLGRSNLVQNLTDNLRFYLATPSEDLDRRPGKGLRQ